MDKKAASMVKYDVEPALATIRRGFQPVPVLENGKKSLIAQWSKLRWEATPDGLLEAKTKFTDWAENRAHTNLGVLLGEPSLGLVDIDLDHPVTRRLQDNFLPYTPARSGTSTRPSTHYWYLVEPGTLQASRFYKMPVGDSSSTESIVEYRSTGGYTVLPPSTHPSAGKYIWSGEEWGGERGPAVVDGRALAVQTATLAFCSLLVEHWPGEGGRHQAYLALAGGILRVGEGVHPYWERHIEKIIEAIAEATGDEDGGEARKAETLQSTIKRLQQGKPTAGWGKLADILGTEVVKQARVILADIESLAGLPPRTSGNFSIEGASKALSKEEHEHREKTRSDSARQRQQNFHQQLAGHGEVLEDEKQEDAEYVADPLEDRVGTWEALDLEPYLTGQVEPVKPTVMERTDGQALMYPGRLNMLYGPSEAAKSWLAMHTCVQEMRRGGRVVYTDFEDEPVNALNRMMLLGATPDDLRTSFKYVRPEEPLSPMQRTRWGESRSTEEGERNNELFTAMLERHDPSLIVADGMTVIYGLHGLDSNDSVQTDVITSWLKSLTRNGRSTVIIVDHTAKNPQRGSLPIGSQHKVAMVQGALLQTYPVKQPIPGAVGEVDLIVLKDRPGQVRAASQKSGDRAQLAAKFIMDSRNPDHVDAKLTLPSEGKADVEHGIIDFRESQAVARWEKQEKEKQTVISCFENDLEMVLTLNQVADKVSPYLDVGAQNQRLRRILKTLEESGELFRLGQARNTRYQLAYVEVEDE